MGIQPIWTYYGQSIFGERLTTVANDLRIFTFNLFHQHLLYRLYTEHAEDVENAKAYYRDWGNNMDVKTGLLIFLEDVVTWVFYEAKDKEQESVSVLGILGLSKARMAFNASDRNPIVLHAHKRFGLLKNQLNLGMTGRYKGPMMKMGFFDRAFEIKDSQNPEWDRVERLMQDWNEALELQDKLLQLITDVLFEAPKKDHPQLLLTDLKAKAIWKKIYAGYLACFGSDQQRRSIRDFWKDKLGLGRGAAASLYIIYCIVSS